MLRHFEKKKFFLVLCGFNRWLESDIMCVFMCLLIAQVFTCYLLYLLYFLSLDVS